LFALYRYIAEESGHVGAGNYIARIEKACMALATHPRRGTRRDDIALGLRTIGFERRVTIAFRVMGDAWRLSPSRMVVGNLKAACARNRIRP
jgi:toxin ParE1/3/4